MHRYRISKAAAVLASLAMAVAMVLVGTSPVAADPDSDAPDVPTNLRITDLSANSVTLAWDPPAGAVSYKVHAHGPTYSSNQHVDVDEPTVTLHLRQGWTYVADVVAYDADNDSSGRMDPADRLEFTMPVDPDDPPVTTPSNVSAEVDPDTLGIVVEWEPSTSEAGGVTYSVRYQEPGGSMLYFEVGEQLTATFYPDVGTTYEVSVGARDAAGRLATPSEPIEVTVPDVPAPSVPENVHVATSPGSATVTWDAPTSGAPVKDYRVTLRNMSGSTVTGTNTTDTSATFDIPPGGERKVTVVAHDWYERRSPTSEPVEFSVEPAEDWQPPSAPPNFRAVPIESPEPFGPIITFMWDAPTRGIEPFTYKIYIGDTWIEQTRELQLDSPYFEECSSDAQPWERATFTVTATSYGVESPPSNPITLCFA